MKALRNDTDILASKIMLAIIALFVVNLVVRADFVFILAYCAPSLENHAGSSAAVYWPEKVGKSVARRPSALF